jgi:hypothetical protein
MSEKVKALIWEEFRVGGAVAGACLFMGACVLGSAAIEGQGMWRADPGLFLSFIIAVPMMTALLLVLNPNNAGHLMGGFSRRVLQLPVEVSHAVAVALTARTLFIFLVMAFMVGVSQFMFREPPGWGTVFMITLFYVAAQVDDWGRGLLSVTVSLLLLAAGVIVVQ